jgi:hypothetical protein
LRDALQMAIEELEASYCPLDESWV